MCLADASGWCHPYTALTQRDIKRILAYSTTSQIGYMFMAVGVGAWSAAIFHLMIRTMLSAWRSSTRRPAPSTKATLE